MPNLPGDLVLAEVEDKGEVNETRGLTADGQVREESPVGRHPDRQAKGRNVPSLGQHRQPALPEGAKVEGEAAVSRPQRNPG